jgi:Mn2+/Fe2+ NRAMP family transporter
MDFKKLSKVALGVVTSSGGFLEVGSIATAAQAGAAFNYQLLWAILVGTLCVIFLIEMSGRLAAISHHPIPAAVRQRFGFNYYILPLIAQTLVDLLVLASEIGGCCLALQLLTGVAFPIFAIPVGLLIWFLLWRGNFGIIEYGVSTLGMITLVFVVAAFKSRFPHAEAAKGFLPTLPDHDKSRYWFLAVSIFGATVSPYLFNFYSSGAIEDEWDESDLWPNRVTAVLGMGFGGMISLAVLIASARIFHTRGILVETYEQIALIVTEPLGIVGFYCFVAALFVACLGAALELSLDISYVYAQTFGWRWGENQRPINATRFSASYTLFIFLASILILTGIDPLKLTIFSMALSALILPLIVLPFIVLMNDPKFVKDHPNGRVSNTIVFVIIILAGLIALAAIPLEIFGGS